MKGIRKPGSKYMFNIILTKFVLLFGLFIYMRRRLFSSDVGRKGSVTVENDKW